MSYTPRTIAVIQAQIIANKNLQTNLSGLNSPSNVSYWKLFTYLQAVGINLLENILSLLQIEIEATVAKGVPGTSSWIRDQVLKFQYQVSPPQVVQINSDFTVSYPIPNPALFAITNCAIVPGNAGIISVKVATGTPPAAISGSVKTALISFLNTILPAGAVFQVISVAADTLRVDAEIFYNGQYTGNIQSAVEAALTDYMNDLPFNGVVKVSDIEKTILSVAGVTDVTFSQITATPNGGGGIDMVLASTENSRSYQTYAGYIINDGSNPFSSTLTYTVANN